MSVVLKPFLRRDSSITLAACNRVIMLLECLKELCEDFIRGALSRFDIWVHLCVIRTSDVVKVDLAVSCLVQDLESFEGKVGSELVHGSNYDSDEFIKVNLTISCVVEALE